MQYYQNNNTHYKSIINIMVIGYGKLMYKLNVSCKEQKPNVVTNFVISRLGI